MSYSITNQVAFLGVFLGGGALKPLLSTHAHTSLICRQVPKDNKAHPDTFKDLRKSACNKHKHGNRDIRTHYLKVMNSTL